MRFKIHLLIAAVLIASIVIFAWMYRLGPFPPTPSELLENAQGLLSQNRDQAALDSLNTLIKKNPKYAQAYRERSFAYGKLEKYDEALADSHAAIALDPKFALAYCTRAAIYILVKRYQDALADSDKAIALDPKLADPYGMRALVYERLENYDKDVEECNKAIALEPKVMRYYLFRATALRHLKKYQEALQDCNKALSLTSKQSGPFIERGFIYLRLGEFHKAVEDYTAAIKLNPQSPQGYLLRADAYRDLGQYQKQIDDLTLAVQISPQLAKVYEQRGHAYYQLGQLQNALADCSKAIGLNANSLCALCTTAASYEDLGLYDKAIPFRTKISSIDAESQFNWVNLGRDYLMLEKISQADSAWYQADRFATPSERRSSSLCNPMVVLHHYSKHSPKYNIDQQLKSKSVVLPFHYDDQNHICVPARVNDHALELMLDTGCNHSELWKQAMPQIGKLENVPLRGATANGTGYSYGSFTARSIQLDTVTLPTVSMAVNDGLVGHKSLSGFLGGNILENFIVTVDYLNKKVILSSSLKPSGLNPIIILPMRVRDHKPYCSVTLDDRIVVSALLDTGGPFNISPDSLLKPIQTEFIFKGHIAGPWIGRLDSNHVRLKSIKLGKSNFDAPYFDVYSAEQAPSMASEIVLGDHFFRRFKTVTFDYPGRQVIFEPK